MTNFKNIWPWPLIPRLHKRPLLWSTHDRRQCAEDENSRKKRRLKVYVAVTFDSDVKSEIIYLFVYVCLLIYYLFIHCYLFISMYIF